MATRSTQQQIDNMRVGTSSNYQDNQFGNANLADAPLRATVVDATIRTAQTLTVSPVVVRFQLFPDVIPVGATTTLATGGGQTVNGTVTAIDRSPGNNHAVTFTIDNTTSGLTVLLEIQERLLFLKLTISEENSLR